MSVLNVCTDREVVMNRRYHQQPEHQQNNNRVYYRRFSLNNNGSTTTDSYDNYSSISTSTRNSSFEVIFSRLLDALIFTSAIAITAYSYLTGTLIQPFVVEPPKPTVLVEYQQQQQPQRRPHSYPKRNFNIDPIEDSKRKRTQEWAEQQIIIPSPNQSLVQPNSPIPTIKKRSCSSTLVDIKKVQPLSQNNNMKREKKRTKSLPVNQTEEKEDELISRLQSLIQQGQDALSSPVK